MQTEIVNLNDLVKKDHPYRKLLLIFNCVREQLKQKGFIREIFTFVDSIACFGCKGKNKHWHGYSRDVSVDMQSGLINKVVVIPF